MQHGQIRKRKSTAEKKQDEIAVNMSGTSYFIVDVDSLVKSTVVKEQVRKAKEIVKNT
ncbi:hypothetical protein MHM93_14640 [Pseudoalteromonas sp. MM17-2]|uniref:hypothetical protein n=1 Tax=Pseudoalteromonas sp. MM17-2 TaxID=2917753 RepID=UPI001EF42B5F|nr:hypothetical protein [Pseudoalteromonas sp. MM17-2]MCG7545416.1 hypothetical protein [Pseudoalteromonas sp. MM17-2]